MGWRSHWNQWLVVAQVGLSCCLLIGAGLFVRTVQKLKALDLGFNRSHLMVFTLDAGKDYGHTRWVNLCHEVRRRVERLPAVVSTSLSSNRSLTGAIGGWGPRKVAVPGPHLGEEEGLEVANAGVIPGYFKTMGIPLLRGRDFGSQDEPRLEPTRRSRPAPVILDETGARRLFGDENPVGRLLPRLASIPARLGRRWK